MAVRVSSIIVGNMESRGPKIQSFFLNDPFWAFPNLDISRKFGNPNIQLSTGLITKARTNVEVTDEDWSDVGMLRWRPCGN